MDYQTFVSQEFIPRVTAMLSGMRDALVAAGVAANNVEWGEIDATDLLYRISASRQGRNLICYIELTDNLHLGGTIPGQAIITVWLEGNNSQITHSYTAGPPRSYTEAEGIDFLLAKIAEAEAAFPELVTKARAYLRV
jgi:hypothetical protein